MNSLVRYQIQLGPLGRPGRQHHREFHIVLRISLNDKSQKTAIINGFAAGTELKLSPFHHYHRCGKSIVTHDGTCAESAYPEDPEDISGSDALCYYE